MPVSQRKNAVQYSRVPLHDLDLNDAPAASADKATLNSNASLRTGPSYIPRPKKKKCAGLKRIMTSIMWIAGAAFVLDKSEAIRVVMEDSRVDRNLVIIAIGLWLTSVMLITNMVFYHWCYESVRDYSDSFPRAVPAVAICFIGSFITMLIGLWGVWRFATFLIVIPVYVALLFSANLLPPWHLH